MIKVQIASRSFALRAGLRALLSSDLNLLFEDDIADGSWMERVLSSDSVCICLQEDWAWIEPFRSQFKGLLVIGDDAALLTKMANSGNLSAWGILPLQSSAEEFRTALEAIDQGLVVMPPQMFMTATSDQFGTGKGNRHPKDEVPLLTEREIEVLGHLARGLQNKQIGLKLSISENTVKFHISSIYSKLGVVNRADAVRAGVTAGLVAL
jgi:two-component system, NarL family, response regulator YdfI